MEGTKAKKKKKINLTTQIENVKSCSLSVALDNFLLDCKARGLAKPTLRNYTKVSQFFIDFIGDINIYEVTENDVKRWIVSLQEKDVKQNTQRTYLKFLKTFLNFYKVDFEVRNIPEERTIKQAFTEEEVRKLLTKPKEKTFTSIRNYTIACFLLATGVRAKTLVEIKVKDLNFNNNTILLTKTKTNKQYYIPLSNTLKQVLKDWLKVYPFANDENSYLFVTHWGEQMSCDTLKSLIQRYNIACGVSGRGTHKYRRTFATNYSRNKGNILYLQQILGHSDLTTTRQYVEINISDIQSNFSEINVLDNHIRKTIKLK